MKKLAFIFILFFVTISIAKGQITVHFEKPGNWSEAWIWYDENSDGSWETTQLRQPPGNMDLYRTVLGMKWFKKELPAANSITFLFNKGSWSGKIDDNGSDFASSQTIWVRANGDYSHNDPIQTSDDTLIIHYKNTKGWTSPYMYAWIGSSTELLGSWPGQAMNPDASIGADWYTKEIIGVTSSNLIFSNNGSDKTGNLSRTDEGWYYNGTWYDSNPENEFIVNIGPYLTWNEFTPSTSGVVVNFETSVSMQGKVEYKKSSSSSWESPISESNNTMHHIELTGLDANTSYDYRLVDGSGKKTDTYTFTTGETNDDEYSFIVLGDMQDPGNASQRWSDIVEAVNDKIANNEVRFLLIAGDMAKDDEAVHWKTFFDKGKSLFSGTVMMPIVGNHDTPTVGSNTNSTSFKYYFDLPGIKEYYSFNYGNAFFLGLYSEKPNDFASGGAQYNWVDTAINENSANYDWNFSYWHIPPYNIGRHAGQQYDFRPITELFQGKVDWVFNGHVHMFNRFKPLKYTSNDASPYQPYLAPSGDYGNGTDDGVGYLVLPPAGQHPSTTIEKQHYIDEGKVASYSRNREIGFAKVTIKQNTIKIITYGIAWTDFSNHVFSFDSVEYSKPIQSNLKSSFTVNKANIREAGYLDEVVGSKFTVYPVPASDFVNIRYDGIKSGMASIKFYNAAGAIIYNDKFDLSIKEKKISVSELNVKGLVLFNIKTKQETFVGRFIIQK